MIPTVWQGVVLAMAAYRLTRLGGWDDFPPVARVRAWLLGETWVPLVHPAESLSEPFSAVETGGPGETPSNDFDDVRAAYTRPLLAHLVHCPFCLGWWISYAVYMAWLVFPFVALTLAAPLALSAFVGLVSKNLDP